MSVTARELTQTGARAEVTLTLDYESRLLRRKVLTLDDGSALLVDFAHTTSLAHGDKLEASDGRIVQVIAAEEPLLSITGDLPRLAWHIGNRHTPAQIEADCILIRRDHVLQDMLERLGASVTEVEAPFTPEGGAYGHGRTHSHSHE